MWWVWAQGPFCPNNAGKRSGITESRQVLHLHKSIYNSLVRKYHLPTPTQPLYFLFQNFQLAVKYIFKLNFCCFNFATQLKNFVFIYFLCMLKPEPVGLRWPSGLRRQFFLDRGGGRGFTSRSRQVFFPEKIRRKVAKKSRAGSWKRERITSKRRERQEEVTRPAGERGILTRNGSVRFKDD